MSLETQLYDSCYHFGWLLHQATITFMVNFSKFEVDDARTEESYAIISSDSGNGSPTIRNPYANLVLEVGP